MRKVKLHAKAREVIRQFTSRVVKNDCENMKIFEV